MIEKFMNSFTTDVLIICLLGATIFFTQDADIQKTIVVGLLSFLGGVAKGKSQS